MPASKQLLAKLDTLLLGQDQIFALLLPYIQEINPKFDENDDTDHIETPVGLELSIFLPEGKTGDFCNNPDVQFILDLYVGEWDMDEDGIYLVSDEDDQTADFWFDDGKE